MNSRANNADRLRPTFSPLTIWAFSIGTSVGWASFVVTCSAYLQKSGVLGTAFGLLLGLIVILVITENLQYLIRKAPDSGGVYTFGRAVGGRDLGFLALWFVMFTYMALLWINLTAVPLFARFIVGDLFQFGPRYTIVNYDVWAGEALLSALAALLVGLVCARSPRLSGRAVIISALVIVGAFIGCTAFALARHEPSFSFEPLYTEGTDALTQILRIAVISPWAFIGFENIAHFSEEYNFPVRRIRGILIWSAAGTALLYITVALLSVSAYPAEYSSWLAYMGDMQHLQGLKSIPAFYAAHHYLGQTGVTALLLAMFCVILTSLFGNMLALSRVLHVAARHGEAPHAFRRLNAAGSPETTVWAIVAASVLMPLLGRTVIGWIVDVTTIGATLIYWLISYTVYRHAQAAGLTKEKFIGAAGIALMACFAFLLLVPGLLPFDAMAAESYVVLVAWALLGFGYYRRYFTGREDSEYGRHVIVWISMLVLVLFASLMWVSRATEKAADQAVYRIAMYDQTHRDSAATALDSKARVDFLHEQAKTISRTNVLYSSVSVILFAICITLLLANYRRTRKLGLRLSAAREMARSAKKIAELKESISALMDNMPGLCASKDAQTGVYLACNQAFAEYARKKTPDDVVGLTDADIFDPATARRAVEDDRMVLSMNGPYIVFEDLTDAAGQQRQFQTTRLKFIDASGRLCTLGIYQDVTDMVRIQREHAQTREAYERARSAGLIFTHIAKTLARGYENLYYVNVESGAFTHYHTDAATGQFSKVQQGEDFFAQCKIDAQTKFHPDDRPIFLKAMDRESLIGELGRSKTVEITCRLLAENRPPYYVRITTSVMEDDERFIVVGVRNVDEEVSQQRAIERAKEERTAYSRINALSGDLLCLYIVDPKTAEWREYSSSSEFEVFEVAKAGKDFFEASRKNIRSVIHPDDYERFLSLFTREAVFSEIQRSGIFALNYRIMFAGAPTHVLLKAAIVHEKEPQLIVGLTNVESTVRLEEDYAQRLAKAHNLANLDALTGVKNRHAYLQAERHMDRQIATGECNAFAITILDVNNLKTVNDTLGHHAGDELIREACRFICSLFTHSPVFRLGGDEFAVISQGSDCERIDDLIEQVAEHNRQAAADGSFRIACGMARFANDACVGAVFERADHKMYENKAYLKSEQSGK